MTATFPITYQYIILTSIIAKYNKKKYLSDRENEHANVDCNVKYWKCSNMKTCPIIWPCGVE